MAQSKIKEEAFSRLDLLKAVVEFKQTFYYTSWAHYEEANPKTFHLLPNKENIANLKQDYQHMHGMIFGDYPPFDEILVSLKNLEEEINNL